MGNEALVMGYETALDFWRASRVASEGQHVLEDAVRVFGPRALELHERAALAANLCNSSVPVDAVVGSVADRRRCRAIRDRVFAGPLTQSHLHVVDQYVSVCQPGPMLVQLAMDMDEVDLAQIACELCGTYGLTPWAEDSFQSDLAALTSRAELVGYAKSARAVGVRGAGKAVRALDLATGGSASPRETDLAVFFLLSRRLGGAGLGGFAVNASLEVSQRHREALEGQSEVKPDFLWADARLVVEYDSNAHHLTPKKKESDEARRRVLEAEGDFCTKNGGRLTRRRLLRRAAAPGVVLPGPPAPSDCPCAQRGRNEGCADGC